MSIGDPSTFINTGTPVWSSQMLKAYHKPSVFPTPYVTIPPEVFTVAKVIPMDIIKAEVKHDANTMMQDIFKVCTTELFDQALAHKLMPMMQKYKAMEDAMVSMCEANQKLLDRINILEMQERSKVHSGQNVSGSPGRHWPDPNQVMKKR